MIRHVLLAVLLLAAAATLLADPNGPVPASKVLVATYRGTTQVVNPGVLICEGGQPTGLPAPMCSPGTKRILIRNMIQEGASQDVTGTAAAMFRGKSTIITQCNLDDKYYGFCWGNLEFVVPEMGGKWEGAFSGIIDFAVYALSVTGDACGYGGKLEGLRMKFEEVWPGGGVPSTILAKVLAQ